MAGAANWMKDAWTVEPTVFETVCRINPLALSWFVVGLGLQMSLGTEIKDTKYRQFYPGDRDGGC